MEEVIFNEKELLEMSEVQPLDDSFDIEKVALLIKKLDEKVGFLKDLKKRRTEDVNKEIAKMENKIDLYRNVILATMEKEEENHLNFPGVCDVKSKKPASTFIVEDEERLIEYLEDEGKKDEIFSVKSEVVMNRNALNKLCRTMNKTGNLPGGMKKVEAKSKQLSLAFEKEMAKKIDLSNIDSTEDIKTDDVGDELDF
jgi:hypothetical protein